MTKGTSSGHVLLELLRQQPLQRLIGAEGLAVFPDAAEPVGLGGVVGQPGVGLVSTSRPPLRRRGAMSRRKRAGSRSRSIRLEASTRS